jgi:hypothetical protein
MVESSWVHWLLYCTCPGWLWWWRICWNEDWQGKLKYSETTHPSATLSTTNPTWPDPESNLGRQRQISWAMVRPRFFLVHYIHVFVSPGFENQIMPLTFTLCYNGILITWTVVSLTTTKLTLLSFYICLHLLLYCKHVHSHEFLTSACQRHNFVVIHTEGWGPCANHGPV